MRYLFLLFFFYVAMPFSSAKVNAFSGEGTAPTPLAGRVALVIGNDNYQDKVHFPSLKVCRNDVDSMATALKASGFYVLTVKDGNRKVIKENIDKFIEMLPANDVALVYYSGHGAEMDSRNYIIPTDLMNPRTGNEVVKLMFKNSAIDVQSTIMSAFAKRQDKVNFLIIDACRVSLEDNSRPNSKAPKTGNDNFSNNDQQPGTTIVFATGERQKSFESKGNNSVFTNELLKHMLIPNLSYKDVFNNAAAGTEELVSKYPNDYVGLQQPQIIDRGTRKFSFIVDETKKAQPEEMRSVSMPAFVVKPTIQDNAVLKRYQNADLSYGYTDQDNKIAILPKYDFCDEEFHEGLAFVQMGKKFGYIDRKGTMVIPCIFDRASSFANERALVYKDGKYGYIDKKGALAIGLQFNSAGTFSEGLAVVKIDDKYGFIDKDGKLVINYTYEEAGSFFDDRACIKSHGKYGYIDKTGKIILPCIYSEFASFKDGLATVKIDDRILKISPIGEVIKEIYTTDRY